MLGLKILCLTSQALQGETPAVPAPQPGQPEHQHSTTENTVIVIITFVPIIIIIISFYLLSFTKHYDLFVSFSQVSKSGPLLISSKGIHIYTLLLEDECDFSYI